MTHLFLQIIYVEPEWAQTQGPGLRNRGPGTLGLAQNPGPACQAGPGFEARPRVPGPRVSAVGPGPGFKALGLGRPGPGPTRALVEKTSES